EELEDSATNIRAIAVATDADHRLYLVAGAEARIEPGETIANPLVGTHGEINIVVRIDKEQWSRAYQGKDHRPRPASAVGEEEAVAVPAGPFLAGEEGQIGDTAHRGRRFHPL